MIQELIDLSVEKLEQNYQRGYRHIGADGTHYKALSIPFIIEQLDSVLCYAGINEPDKFLVLVHQIVGHQSYHVEVDEVAQTSYYGISRMLAHGAGNPRIDALENVLNGIGASLAICRIDDRENDVPHNELPRACFFQHEIGKERWYFRDTIKVLSANKLQFRVFSLKDAKERNTIEHCINFSLTEIDEDKLEQVWKSLHNIISLLRWFNVLVSVNLTIQPPTASHE